MTHTDTPSTPAQDAAIEALQEGIEALMAIMEPDPLTPENAYHRAKALIRELADQLDQYAVSSTNFDEDAFYTVEKAERFLFDATLFSGTLASPQGHR
jgi:hypothetical protein